MTETDARYRHASGDDADGCMSCLADEHTEGVDVATIVQCSHPEPDPADIERCRWCGHTVERVA